MSSQQREPSLATEERAPVALLQAAAQSTTVTTLPRPSLARRLRPWLANPALLVGGIIVIAFLVIELFPGAFAPYDPEAKGRFLQEIDGEVYAAPFPPTSVYPLGSDGEARDLLSRLIYGGRHTLVIAMSVAVLRLFLGAGLGLIAGWVGGAVGGWALVASSVSATIPSLLFAWIVILAIGQGSSFVVFILALGLTGWAHWTQMLSLAVRRIRTQPYMEAAEAVGVPPNTQLRRHILPNLLPLIIPTLSQEVGATLLILAELGFLGVFYADTVVINFTDLLQQRATPNTMEWAGMLAGTRLEVFRWYWLPLAPAGAFFIAIIGFNLLATGLREALEPLGT